MVFNDTKWSDIEKYESIKNLKHPMINAMMTGDVVYELKKHQDTIRSDLSKYGLPGSAIVRLNFSGDIENYEVQVSIKRFEPPILKKSIDINPAFKNSKKRKESV